MRKREESPVVNAISRIQEVNFTTDFRKFKITEYSHNCMHDINGISTLLKT